MLAVLGEAGEHTCAGTSFAGSTLSLWAFSVSCTAGINVRLVCPEDCLLWRPQGQSAHLFNPSHHYSPASYSFLKPFKD